MKYASLSWEGSLIGPETLEKISDENALPGQKPADFGLKGKIRDEILEAWAEAKAQWQIFSVRRSKDDTKDQYGTSRTRAVWVMPFLSLLGYELENATAVEIGGRNYAISHRAVGRACSVHIVGFNESLDKRREGSKASPHSLVQEYVNVSDTLYALVTNGLCLRLLRDSSRLIKLSYLEFNLERIFEEELFSDFALLFRLLHISRWPRRADEAADCLLEKYHQDSLENGSAIRKRLSAAVKSAIEDHWANGLLNHPDNGDLRMALASNRISARDLYNALLTLVYRVLFLLVIEERDLTHPEGADKNLKALYRNYYSLAALRTRCRKVMSEEGRFGDLWATLVDCFSLYEDGERATKLGLKPLAGDLFSPEAFALLKELSLDNRAFAAGIQLLDSYEDEKRGVPVRVNYAALNVEEFGSIYEGLLEFDASIDSSSDSLHFSFTKGEDRGKTGSHYTPEELVQPLIEHALEPLIEKCLKESDAETRLLDLKICDDACGSGHILLNAARRIALELARLRTKADNPDPASYRHALREVIERCIYGVDFNPQAVRLCKVALWLESHNPGESLGFLDHHIKCGDSLVGLTKAEDLLEPIPIEAFASRDGDDKDYASQLRAKQKEECTTELVMQHMTDWRGQIGDSLKTVIDTLKTVSRMPDATSDEAARKKELYLHITCGEGWRKLKALADIRLAPFFTPKKPEMAIATEKIYRDFLNGREDIEGHPIAEEAGRASERRNYFHWFLEFAEVMQGGGFDCFLGNPPFTDGQDLSGLFGKDFIEHLKFTYKPAKVMNLAAYFFRRNYSLVKESRSIGSLASNSIAQGKTREGGLAHIESQGGSIIMAVRSRSWPGEAAVEVSLAAIYKGNWTGLRILDGKPVSYISTFFDTQLTIGEPFPIVENSDKSFQGSIVLGQGFMLDPNAALELIAGNSKCRDVLFPYINGEDLNGSSNQSPSRWVINFQDWPLDIEHAPEGYSGPVAADYPECLEIVEHLVKPERMLKKGDRGAEYWWQFLRVRGELYRTIAPLERVLVVAKTSPKGVFTFLKNDKVLDQALTVYCSDKACDLAILNSSIADSWFKKYGTTQRNDFRLNQDLLETLPLPRCHRKDIEADDKSHLSKQDLNSVNGRLDSLGSSLEDTRSEIMLRLDIGLTKLYNLYHTPNLDAVAVRQESKCSDADAEWTVPKILALRDIHKAIDEAVRDAYGWNDLPLQHGFHELEFLPEGDRVRYTISNDVRRIILRELLTLNHKRHAEEVAAGLVDEKGKIIKKKDKASSEPKKRGSKKKTSSQQSEMFS